MKKLIFPIRFRAKVVKGLGRGRQLGIPTVNLDPSALLRTGPRAAGDLQEGIWICKVFLPLAYLGVLHYGPRPTFGESDRSLEVYFLDFDEETSIPGELDVEIHSYIRKVIKFKNPKALLEEVNKDIEVARKLAL